MLCQRCKKKQATVHLTTVVDNQMQEKHLCEQCAAQLGETVSYELSLDQILKKFIVSAGAEDMSHLTCPQCGTTFMQFRNTGLLGCPADYDAFKEPLTVLVERAHGGRTQHVGKVPRGRENKRKRQHELMHLKNELEQAVQIEDYEQAAILRDKIAKLEQQ